MDEHFDNVFRDWQDLLEKIYRESTFLCAAKRDKMDPSKFWQVVMIQYSGQFNTGLSEEFQNFIYAVLSIPFSSAAVESGKANSGLRLSLTMLLFFQRWQLDKELHFQLV